MVEKFCKAVKAAVSGGDRGLGFLKALVRL